MQVQNINKATAHGVAEKKKVSNMDMAEVRR